MDALTYSYTRQHFADVMRKVNDDCAPVVVTSQRGKPVVISRWRIITRWKRPLICCAIRKAPNV